MTHNNLVIHSGRQSTTTTPPNHRRRWTPADAARLRWEAETYIGDANYLRRLAAREACMQETSYD